MIKCHQPGRAFSCPFLRAYFSPPAIFPADRRKRLDIQRLDKILASTGRWSRREVKLLVRQGRVLVNGVPAASAEEKYDPAGAELTVDGEILSWQQYTWLMMNKPGGVLSATEDGRGKTVLDLLEPDLRRLSLFPVGRLDKDTEGLLLLTNDGQTAHRLLSPAITWIRYILRGLPAVWRKRTAELLPKA